MSGWYKFKLFAEHASGISMDALHVVVGFGLFLMAARLLKRPVTSFLPLSVLLILELGNEAYDFSVEIWPTFPSQLGEGTKDILLTMMLPTLLLSIARWRPHWLTAQAIDRPQV